MKINTVKHLYFSPAGTTKTIVERTATGFAGASISCDLLRHPLTVPEPIDDLLIVGVPVYAGRVPSVCAQSLRQLKGNRTPAIAIVVYGNRDYDDALLELTDILREVGFVVIGAAAFVAQHSIFPEVGINRPDEHDLKLVDQFYAACAKSLEDYPEKSPMLHIKGNFPYKKPGIVPLKPSGDAKCNRCGACVQVCPMHAIDMENPHKTKGDVCISCTACIHACPQHARAFHGVAYKLASKGFTKKCTLRKEPEWFLFDPT